MWRRPTHSYPTIRFSPSSGRWPTVAPHPQAAWTLAGALHSTVVAVLDTGVLPHADLHERLLPGHDFVSRSDLGNDGDGRDADPTDPGDWLEGNESWTSAAARSSSWHGTHVAGVLAATGGNALGMVGVDPRARLLPVRVLGRGGGHMSDVAEGLLWAVGASVPGVPLNPTPARVVNLSLGGAGRCSLDMQNALDEARARGAVVVASAGNASQDVAATLLASCQRVLVVSALGRQGELAAYSNFGAGVSLAAPGGNVPSDNGILSLGDQGTRQALNDNSYRRKQGSSLAAPHVAGVVSLMLAVNPGLTPAQVETLLRASVRGFRSGSANDCVPGRCGAGVLDAAAAVALASFYPAHLPVTEQRLPSRATVPEAGWWRDSLDPAVQVLIDVRGPEVLLATQVHDSDGRPTWARARLVHEADTGRYVGPLHTFVDGAGLVGAARVPLPASDLGQVVLDPTAPDGATLTLHDMRRTLVRDRPVASGVSGTSGVSGVSGVPGARTGFWWAPARPGQGFAVEQQGNRLRVSALVHADDGRPIWFQAHTVQGGDGVFRGQWHQSANGSALTGAARTPTTTLLAGAAAEWRGLSALEASLQLPDGALLTMEAGVGTSGEEAQAQSARLLGLWRSDYTVLNALTERWTLAHLAPSQVNVGDINVWGVNQWGGVMVGGWSSRYANHSLYAPGLALDDFYLFQFNGDELQGCYHYHYIALDQLSACHPFSGTREGSAANALAAVPTLPLGAVGNRAKEAQLITALQPRGVQGGVSSEVWVKSAGGSSGQAREQLQGWQQQVAAQR